MKFIAPLHAALATTLLATLTASAYHISGLSGTDTSAIITPQEAGNAAAYTFSPGNGTFLLNGLPFVVKAAELHYPRIPKEYWEHRILMCKALGMNTICLYTFWNVHEPSKGNFDFTGQNDIRRFIQLCDKHGLKVILRPGPYVCAEWEMGGLPWWLLRKKDIRLRESDPYFLERVNTFQQELAHQVGDLTAEHGGPIIMIQVENEYGSYGEDKIYIAQIRDMLRKHFGNSTTMFQCDWSSNFELNGLDDLVWTMNFGTGANIDDQFQRLKELRPESPLMCSEFWSGWFDKWGANHETRLADEMISGIDEMLSKDISFSLYMTHGGTNPGHWAGANSPGYAPDVTSYDYDAPINEQGSPTPKYMVLRNLMQKYSATPLPDIPDTIPTMALPDFTLSEFIPLGSALPAAIHSHNLQNMEALGQGFGSLLYSTTLPKASSSSTLIINEPHDYARVFINGQFIGSLDRRLDENILPLPKFAAGDRLDILVEATGRINFGRAIKDFKGITDKGTLVTDPIPKSSAATGRELVDWEIYPLPDDYDFYKSMLDNSLQNTRHAAMVTLTDGRRSPGVFHGYFTLPSLSESSSNTGLYPDTFLDFSNFGKGLVYVNGHPLGRIWEIGPQQTLYMPGVWLRPGENEVIVFDVIGSDHPSVRGLSHPVNDMVRTSSDKTSSQKITNPTFTLPEYHTTSSTYSFPPGNGWKEIRFDSPRDGNRLILEAIDAADGSDAAAIAELYLLDSEGNRLDREKWRVVYADSEDAAHGNHTAEKAFDLQESTYWSSAPQAPFPHYLVIDLGDECIVSGIQYLPRMEKGAPCSIANFRITIAK